MSSNLTSLILTGALWQIISNLSAFGAIILIILVLMSIVSWGVIIRKLRQFRTANADTTSFLEYFRRSRKIDEVSVQARTYRASPLASLYSVGLQEVTALRERKNQAPGLQGSVVPLDNGDFELVEMAMERGLNNETAKMEKQVVFLATTGSSAPFMGLLGTVVGIMDSFWAIGERGSASLAVVAPGIAEALLATIVGLGAAIPAVIAYNWANNTTKVLQNQGYNFVLEFISRVRKEAMP